MGEAASGHCPFSGASPPPPLLLAVAYLVCKPCRIPSPAPGRHGGPALCMFLSCMGLPTHRISPPHKARAAPYAVVCPGLSLSASLACLPCYTTPYMHSKDELMAMVG